MLFWQVILSIYLYPALFKEITLRMSRQIAPVTEETFGCQIFVTKRTLGGLKGYVSGILISS
jgi:hypothetical protein